MRRRYSRIGLVLLYLRIFITPPSRTVEIMQRIWDYSDKLREQNGGTL